MVPLDAGTNVNSLLPGVHGPARVGPSFCMVFVIVAFVFCCKGADLKRLIRHKHRSRSMFLTSHRDVSTYVQELELENLDRKSVV